MTEDFYDTVLRCGLYFGALFQFICIVAVLVIPDSSASGTSDSKEDGSEDEISDQNSPLASPRKPHVHHRPRKPDKKKRR